MASNGTHHPGIWDAPLDITDFNVLIAFLGGWISLFGLVSYLLKEDYYMSEALISLLFGVAFGPHAANFIRPEAFAQCVSDDLSAAECQENLDAITLNFSRLVLGVQLVLAGVQLPSKYLKKEAKPLSIMLGPGMVCMWMATSLIVWALVPDIPFLHALAVGSCVTPTDPVLSAVIVKGKFADHNIPKDLQDLIVAESGANDGLGYPFLFFALYLIKYVGKGATTGNAGDAMGLWFGMTWAYVILLSVAYGFVVGWIAKELLHWAREKGLVDRESFLVFAISLALFVLGTCGLIGTDDVLACFVAGNSFTWDDWFRIETKDDSLQPTIDMLLNVTIFLWYGAVIPWHSFAHNPVVPIYRLIPLGILVLLLRRLPWIFSFHKFVHQIKEKRQAIFVGFFGPIGVSAVFYLFITLEFIDKFLSDGDGRPRDDVKNLAEVVRVVVWFMAVCSMVIHGLSIPLGKVGYLMPRTISRAISESNSEDWRNRPIIGSKIIASIAGSRSGSRAGSRSNSRAPAIDRIPDLEEGRSERVQDGENSTANPRARSTVVSASDMSNMNGHISPAPGGDNSQLEFDDAGGERLSTARPPRIRFDDRVTGGTPNAMSAHASPDG